MDSSDDEYPVRIVRNYPPVKKADLKATPPKDESDEVKILKEAMASMRSELSSTRLLFEELLTKKDSARNSSEGKTLASHLPLEHPKDQQILSSTISKSAQEENLTERSRIDYSSFSESRESFAIHLLDVQQRELLSRQSIQLAQQKARDMEEEVIRGRKDNHELHMLILKNLAGRR